MIQRIEKTRIFEPRFYSQLYLLTKSVLNMKKLFILAIAAVGMTFVSCDNKAKPEATDTTEVVDTLAVLTEEANTAADEVIAALTENIEKKDAGAIETALKAVKEKIGEFLAKNPEVAKEYLAKVQNFIKENKDKLTAVIGSVPAVSSLMDSITALPSETVDGLLGATDGLKALGIDAADLVKGAADDAVDAAKDAVEGVKDAAADAVEGAKDAVDGAADAAKDAAKDAVQAGKDAAGAAVDKAADAAKKGLGL